MTFSKEATIARIDYRIKLMRARGEGARKNLINALIRERRNLEEKNV